MFDRTGLADFLRRRRETLRPVDAGIPVGNRRRTPGLRREEVAALAGISTDYYSRLEQARGSTPSASVIASLARALQCDLDQRDHLFHLAGVAAPPRRAGGHVRPGLIALANRLVDIPVMITTDLGELVWRNALAQALMRDFPEGSEGPRNVIWRWFAEPMSRPMPEAEWARISASHVSDLRAAHARRSADAEVTRLVNDLVARSAEFRELWSRHDVGVRRSDIKTVVHPEVGLVQLRCEVLLTPAEDVELIAFFPLEGTDADEKLQLLRVIGSQQFSSAGGALPAPAREEGSDHDPGR
ncbi:Helix-turn-helix domain-containing protein [Paramicrobacterium humi]|uniref:Helix-turn-helix domain-containing protein n=1 Tax=Paramicrobacterium humi TaxID=640635 RepID=A0A1H4N0K6_9MICO|nr:helix-turn-helix transcriptional regulator [Microbacterium humi]SEB88753.1 Helix-turn-helix domain-containing protein [Microbacterium humi]